MDENLISQIRERAGNICEYCLMPQTHYPITFHVDHVIARQHAGSTSLGNLALCCLHCNSHKGPNIAGLDPLTRKLTRLFNPRRHKWTRHFRWDGTLLVGRTAVGRTTIAVLNINGSFLRQLREALVEEGLFPIE